LARIACVCSVGTDGGNDEGRDCWFGALLLPPGGRTGSVRAGNRIDPLVIVRVEAGNYCKGRVYDDPDGREWTAKAAGNIATRAKLP
jgi:hypothetical protein